MEKIAAILVQREMSAFDKNQTQIKTNTIYSFPLEYVDIYLKTFLRTHCPRIKSLTKFAAKVKVLRLATDLVSDDVEFRLIITGLIKSLYNDDWESAKRLFLEKVVTNRNLGAKRVERVIKHTNVDILKGEFFVTLRLTELLDIVIR